MPNTIVTRGLGRKQQLPTRGYGGTLVVIVVPGPGGGPTVIEPYYGPLIPGSGVLPIQTRTIFIPAENKTITVDVLLVSGSNEVNVAAMLSDDKYDYDHIEVYMLDEVEIHDKN